MLEGVAVIYQTNSPFSEWLRLDVHCAELFQVRGWGPNCPCQEIDSAAVMWHCRFPGSVLGYRPRWFGIMTLYLEKFKPSDCLSHFFLFQFNSGSMWRPSKVLIAETSDDSQDVAGTGQSSGPPNPLHQITGFLKLELFIRKVHYT